MRFLLKQTIHSCGRVELSQPGVLRGLESF